MTLENILKKLKSIKPDYAKEGLNILGVFGSYARNQATKNSDIDILVETNNLFMVNHPDGFSGFSRLVEIKLELEKAFNSKVDLVDKVGLLQHNNTHILKSTVYV